MRTINSEQITETITTLCQTANYELPDDVVNALIQFIQQESYLPAQNTLKNLLKNADIAKNQSVPICQDTGMTCVFLEIGQDIHIAGQYLIDAIHEGVRKGYSAGYLRKSIVKDPLVRENTHDNTPARIHIDIVKGSNIKITVAPKGFGSENMSRISMLRPSDGLEGIMDFVLNSVKLAGANPCPPIIVGVGIGSNFDGVALLSKKALLRPINIKNQDSYYAQLEQQMLCSINQLGIGPQGFGGKCTALGLNIEAQPTHIAGLPVAVNICCHASRHLSAII